MVTKERFYQARGGRKTAYATARVLKGTSGVVVNEKKASDYFKIPKLLEIAESSLKAASSGIGATVRVSGGGINAQASAVRNAIARALVKWNEGLRPQLRSLGFLTRDARMVERKKYGLKKARRAPQWSKR